MDHSRLGIPLEADMVHVMEAHRIQYRSYKYFIFSYTSTLRTALQFYMLDELKLLGIQNDGCYYSLKTDCWAFTLLARNIKIAYSGISNFSFIQRTETSSLSIFDVF